MKDARLVPQDRIENAIRIVRGQRGMLDADLATLCGVEVKVLNQTVKRNIQRSPPDFMFRLTADEQVVLRSQFVTLETGRGRHRKYLLPWRRVEP